MINSFKQNLINVPGWHTTRKIVVFESDDWGAQRMPSKIAFNALIKSGIRVDRSKFDSLDTLENESDLNALFDVLSSYKNKNGKSPKFTCNFVMGNPDFDAIRKNGFQSFIHEHMFDSYEKYHQQSLENIWEAAMNELLIVPQFHAREHLNIDLWMKDLQEGNKDTLTAFGQNFYGLKTKTGSPFQKHYLAAYYAESPVQLKKMKDIVQDGLYQFEQTFGFRSNSFIGCNYVWPKSLEQHLHDKGVKVLQGQRGHLDPRLNGKKPKVRYHYTGQRNKYNQVYLVRNILFEPYNNIVSDWVNHAIRSIQNSFFWGKPAIISSHRINYVSNMDVKHRDSSLRQLSELLKCITQKWPEVEFMSTNELGEIIQQ